MQSRSVFGIDIFIIGASVALTVIGVLFIYSSGITSNGRLFTNEYIRQVLWGATGLALLFVVAFVGHTTLKSWAVPFYVATIVLLLFTLAFGRVMHGARAWLGIGGLGIQPSEFAKLACILVLARYLEGVGEAVKRIPILFKGAGIVLLPIALTLAQPDFGTAMVFLPLYVVMAFAAGARLRHLAYMVLFLAVTGVFTMVPIWERNIYEGSISAVSVLTDPGALGLATAGLGTVTAIALIGFVATKRTYFYWLVYGTSILLLALPVAFAARATLAEYQLARLVVFLDPYTDPRGAGWNIIQSVTAVGSGGFTGRGFLEGTHSHYQYIPEQSTDFIFSILAEEWGFLGG
ncbi:MAG: rod shape-determining protein RodA, partial [Spirochaetaceae bacterium]